MVTMKDVALATEVSISTVSRVLSGKDRGRIKPEMAEKIRKVAEEMGYRPNLVARNLKTNSSRILGFISDEIATTPFAGRIILGAQDAARDLGYILFSMNTGNDAELEKREIDAAKRYGVDGFLYAMMYDRPVSVPAVLDGIPTVVIDAVDENSSHPSIGPDERGIAYSAVERLLQAGCRRIVYLDADASIYAQKERLIGYREAMERSHCGFDESMVLPINERGPQEVVDRFFDETNPDGVFCFNDVRAPLAYRAIARRGWRVGRECSVIGVDNQPFVAGLLVPELSSVELPHYEMGYWGVRKLVSLVEEWNDDTDIVSEGASAAGNANIRVPLPSLRFDAPRISCMLIEKGSVAR